jgi:hypothetical protein
MTRRRGAGGAASGILCCGRSVECSSRGIYPVTWAAWSQWRPEVQSTAIGCSGTCHVPRIVGISRRWMRATAIGPSILHVDAYCSQVTLGYRSVTPAQMHDVRTKTGRAPEGGCP